MYAYTYFSLSDPHLHFSASSSSHRSEVKARQDVKPDFRHPTFTDYRQPPVDYRHPPVTDYRQPPTLDYRQPPGLLDFRQHPAAAQFPLGIPTDFRPQVGTPSAKSLSKLTGLFSSAKHILCDWLCSDLVLSAGLRLLHCGAGEKLQGFRLQHPWGPRIQDGPVCAAAR